MKKIVALVLSLVMVLGLATTAFGATTSTGTVNTTSVTPVKAAFYDLATGKTGAESMVDRNVTIAKIELTTTSGKVVEDVPMYVPNFYNITLDNGSYYHSLRSPRLTPSTLCTTTASISS